MKNMIISLYIFIYSQAIFSSCIQSSAQSYIKKEVGEENIFIRKSSRHILFYAEDTCGAKGCELRVLTQVDPFCLKESLTTKGFFILDSLNSRFIEIRKDGKLKRYKYYDAEWRFR